MEAFDLMLSLLKTELLRKLTRLACVVGISSLRMLASEDQTFVASLKDLSETITFPKPLSHEMQYRSQPPLSCDGNSFTVPETHSSLNLLQHVIRFQIGLRRCSFEKTKKLMPRWTAWKNHVSPYAMNIRSNEAVAFASFSQP